MVRTHDIALTGQRNQPKTAVAQRFMIIPNILVTIVLDTVIHHSSLHRILSSRQSSATQIIFLRAKSRESGSFCARLEDKPGNMG